MSTLTIRNIEPAIKEKLRLAAAAHKRSMEEEVRVILRNTLAKPASANRLGSSIHARFAALGAVTLDMPDRTELPRAADFTEGNAK